MKVSDCPGDKPGARHGDCHQAHVHFRVDHWPIIEIEVNCVSKRCDSYQPKQLHWVTWAQVIERDMGGLGVTEVWLHDSSSCFVCHARPS